MEKSKIRNILNGKEIKSFSETLKDMEDVEVETEKETKEIWLCPYCESEIGEKEFYFDQENDKWYHRPCKDEGAIKLPEENSDLIMNASQKVEIKEFGQGEDALSKEQVKSIKEGITGYLDSEENRWFNLYVNSFGVGPLQGGVAGVTRFELQPTQRHVEVVLDQELVDMAPEVIVSGVMAHELKHVNQVKSGRINRLDDRAEIEKEAYQHERRFFLRHREDHEGTMLNVIDERIAQIDQIIQAYENGEMMLMAKDVQIGFKK